MLMGGETGQLQSGRAVGLFQRDVFARLDDNAFVRFEFTIGFDSFEKPPVIAAVGIVLGNAVVVNHADRQQFRQFRRPAEMVGMKMRGDEIIHFLQTGDFSGHVMNAFGIASAGISGINQHGFVRRRHDERRAAAFGVNPIDIESFVRLAPLSGRRSENCESGGKYADELFHNGWCGWQRNMPCQGGDCQVESSALGWVAQSVEQRTENHKTPFSLRCAAFSDYWLAQCSQGFMHFCLLPRQTAFCFENAFGYTMRDTKENSPASNPLLPLSKPSNRGFKPASHGLRFCSLFVYREIIHCNLAPSGTDSHPRIQPAIILSVLIPKLAIN